MGQWKDMWKQVDEMRSRSQNEFNHAKEEIAKLEGWTFKGCDDGVVWKARHQKESITITARSSNDLVTKVRAKHGEMQAAERRRAEEEAVRKAKGDRP